MQLTKIIIPQHSLNYQSKRSPISSSHWTSFYNMKLSTILTTVTLMVGISIDSASARCFLTGSSYRDKEETKGHIRNACAGYFNGQGQWTRGALQGFFAKEQTKGACVRIDDDQSVKFSVKNLNTRDGFDLADGDCIKELNREVDLCNRGGESTTAGWRFRWVVYDC